MFALEVFDLLHYYNGVKPSARVSLALLFCLKIQKSKGELRVFVDCWQFVLRVTLM